MASLQVSIRQLSDWAYAERTSPITRLRGSRMREMVRRIGLPEGARVIDLGGTAHLWASFEHRLDVTLVTVPPRPGEAAPETSMRVIHADACDLSRRFEDESFDLAFSNSVIEHVGGPQRRRAFAGEARRLGRAYWVQTPSDHFPIEAHTGVPFYFSLPGPIRDALHRRWAAELPEWYEMIAGTDVVTRAEMARLFPDAEVYTERILGLEKSYSFYRPYRAR
jgi:hypothetical protein